MNQLEIIPAQNKEFKAILFMDKEIDCILVEGEPRVIVNSVIEAIGLWILARKLSKSLIFKVKLKN